MIYFAVKNKYFLSVYLLFSKFVKKRSKAYLEKTSTGRYRLYTNIAYCGSTPVKRIGFCSWQLYVWPGGNPQKEEVGDTLLEHIRKQL